VSDVKVLIADSAAEHIQGLARNMTGKQQRMLTGWLERLTPEKLMDEGVALMGTLKGKYQFRSERYRVRIYEIMLRVEIYLALKTLD